MSLPRVYASQPIRDYEQEDNGYPIEPPCIIIELTCLQAGILQSILTDTDYDSMTMLGNTLQRALNHVNYDPESE